MFIAIGLQQQVKLVTTQIAKFKSTKPITATITTTLTSIWSNSPLFVDVVVVLVGGVVVVVVVVVFETQSRLSLVQFPWQQMNFGSLGLSGSSVGPQQL